MRILVTGGCGFIGSNFIRMALSSEKNAVVNLDSLTYAANPENLKDVDQARYLLIQGSISDAALVNDIMESKFDAVVNFAAESHVDRSLLGSALFARTNVEGTIILLEAARRHGAGKFLQVSTDEVYGSLPEAGIFIETTPLDPKNPYSVTKAAADFMAQAHAKTFGFHTVITRSSNNYGPFQYPEKFIPLFVTNALEGKDCPLYGDGMNVRDWLHVEDNCRGIMAALERGRAGEVYNLGGGNERPNIEVARAIMRGLGKPESLIKLVKDRLGHDRRYAIDCSKAKRELGWAPEIPFEKGLEGTLRWYRSNTEWIERSKGRKGA